MSTASPEPKAERDYLKEEIETLIYGRYGSLTAFDTLAVLEVIKLQLFAKLPVTGSWTKEDGI